MNQQKKDYPFPHRLWGWFLSRQILISGLYLVLLNLLLLVWLDNYSGWSEEVRAQSRLLLFFAYASSFLITVLVSVLMARRLVVPLGRLISKTQSISEFPFDDVSKEREEDLALDEPGEWYDLEKALNRLALDLREKTILLSREKTELRTLMNSISEAVLAVGLQKEPLFYNPQFALLFSLQSFEGKPPELLSDIVRSPELIKAYDLALSTGKPQVAQCHLTLSKGPGDFMVSVSPLTKKHNQEIYGAVGSFAEITELIKAERVRIEFVGNVSHELRTPLTSIKGYLQTALIDVKENKTDQLESFLEIVARNVDRLIVLVTDLLELSAMESGGALQESRVRTRELTEAVLSQVPVENHQVRIEYQIEELEADGPRLEQVLRNLVQNAVRYVPIGGEIRIRWDEQVEPHLARLSVKDNGPGIPKEHHDRLFERFYRIDEARSREVGGSGIGLSLVKHIMQRHQGRVFVLSEPGYGAEFVCEFPQG